MLLRLDEHNNVVVTEKFLMVEILHKLHAKHKRTPEIAAAHFATLYYMYHFDSRFLWLHRDDEVKRLSEVRKFITNGKLVKICNTMQRAMKMYKTLYNEESVSLYLVMRDNLGKMKDYMGAAQLMAPTNVDPDAAEAANLLIIDSKEMREMNKAIPDQWKLLDGFEKELLEHTKSAIDIYGGGNLGAYE